MSIPIYRTLLRTALNEGKTEFAIDWHAPQTRAEYMTYNSSDDSDVSVPDEIKGPILMSDSFQITSGRTVEYNVRGYEHEAGLVYRDEIKAHLMKNLQDGTEDVPPFTHGYNAFPPSYITYRLD